MSTVNPKPKRKVTNDAKDREIKALKLQVSRLDDAINTKIGYEKLFKAAITVFDPSEYHFAHLQELCRVRATKSDDDFMKFALDKHMEEREIPEGDYAEFLRRFEESGGNEQYENDHGTVYFGGISSADFYDFARKLLQKKDEEISANDMSGEDDDDTGLDCTNTGSDCVE